MTLSLIVGRPAEYFPTQFIIQFTFCHNLLVHDLTTKYSDTNSPAYNRRDQSQDESTTCHLFEKGLKSNSKESVTEYGRSLQSDNQSQILQPRHKYCRNSNHHRIVKRRKSI